jgi:hypothetical protein
MAALAWPHRRVECEVGKPMMTDARDRSLEMAGPATGSSMRTRLVGVTALASVVTATTYVGLVDPETGGAYPICPSQLLLGLDCPSCGALRGVHALLQGDVAQSLDHNLLLPAVLAMVGVALTLWVLRLAGRHIRTWVVPHWAKLVAGAVAVVFTILRNLPVASLEFLASGASS